jgi:spore coat polysaccharide biosynthesis protein SpsF
VTTLTIVQVRIGSTRLPGKALLPIAGKPMLAYVIEAAPEPMIVACPATDYAIMDICRELGVPFAKHLNTDDVLSRFVVALDMAEAAHGVPIEWVLRITADCPMLTQAFVLRFLRMCDYEPGTIYTNRPGDPDGLDLELFSVDALRWASRKTTSKYNREHVTPIMYRYLTVRRLRVSTLDPRAKISVDTREDYLLVKALMERRQT